jgi:hypothetical protein
VLSSTTNSHSKMAVLIDGDNADSTLIGEVDLLFSLRQQSIFITMTMLMMLKTIVIFTMMMLIFRCF